MNIKYFFRHPKVGHSIHRVFRTLIGELGKKVTIQKYEVPCKGSMPLSVIKNNFYVLNKRNHESIHHITGHIHDVLLALVGVKTVLTIHDLVFLDNVKNPFKRFYKWLFWLYLPIKIADVVVCISNQTKQNILKKIKTDKLIVIHNAVDTIYEYSPKPFNSEKPLILHIGTGWNKNLSNSIKALEGISCNLRIIGRLNKDQLELLEKHHIEYSNGLDLTDEDIKEEYLKCDIVNFPSIYEGFGMPVIEGQKTGRIVLTSLIEPLLEVADNAAVFVDPKSISSLREAYLKIIANEEFRNNTIQKGLKNAQRFSIKSIAEQYLSVYEKLYSS